MSRWALYAALALLTINLNLLSAYQADCDYKFLNIYGIDRRYTCQVCNVFPNLRSDYIFIGSHKNYKTDKDVKAIYIRNKKLNVLDSTLCDVFKNLEIIVTRYNEFTDVQEDALKNCENLEELSISGASIRELTEKFLPEHSLFTLDLGENELNTLPENFLRNQVDLEVLDLTTNHINYLPSRFFEPVKNLRQLKLYNNKIEKLEPVWFKSLKNLELLWLEQNSLTELQPGIFKPLTNIKKLSLSKNQLTTVHSDSFGVHKKMTHLSFYQNLITSIDEKIIDSTVISNFDIAGNICSRNYTNPEGRKSVKLRYPYCFANYNPRSSSSQLPPKVSRVKTTVAWRPVTTRTTPKTTTTATEKSRTRWSPPVFPTLKPQQTTF